MCICVEMERDCTYIEIEIERYIHRDGESLYIHRDRERLYIQ